MKLASQLTYNDLNGDEAVEVLCDWFHQLLKSDPLMQPHLTLPMAKITLNIGVQIDMYVGGTVPVVSAPDRRDITGAVTLSNDLSGGAQPVMSATGVDRRMEHRESKLTTVVNAAPLPGGEPPDKIREKHDLPIPRPSYGPRETGSHLFLSDAPEQPLPPDTERLEPSVLDNIIEESSVAKVDARMQSAGGRRGMVADGYVLSSERAGAQVDEQVIPADNGDIQIDLVGKGIQHAGITVKDDSHRKSKTKFGDRQGEKYSSVNAVYDPGARGLTAGHHGGGLYSDGRARIGFGNQKH